MIGYSPVVSVTTSGKIYSYDTDYRSTGAGTGIACSQYMAAMAYEYISAAPAVGWSDFILRSWAVVQVQALTSPYCSTGI